MFDDSETITMRPTVIGGDQHADDFEVIWRGLIIGRILKQPGAPIGQPQWFGCNLPPSCKQRAISGIISISRIARPNSESSGLGYGLRWLMRPTRRIIRAADRTCIHAFSRRGHDHRGEEPCTVTCQQRVKNNNKPLISLPRGFRLSTKVRN
jgi:hypothetical protein